MSQYPSNPKDSNFSPVLKLLDPKNDYVFKRAFGEPKRKHIFIDFLNAVLNGQVSPIVDLKYITINNDVATENTACSFVDVMCTGKDGTKFILEMQKSFDPFFVKRLVSYSCGVYMRQKEMFTEEQKEELKQKYNKRRLSGYEEMYPVRLVAILEHSIFPQKQNYLAHYRTVDILQDPTGLEIDEISYTVLDLQKFNKRYKDLKDDIDRWAYFFKNAQKIDQDTYINLTRDNNIFVDVYKAVNETSFTKDELDVIASINRAREINEAARDYEMDCAIEEAERIGMEKGMEKGMKDGLEKGLKEGMKEGEKSAKIKIAENLIKMNILTVAQIANASGLEEKEVENILKNIK